MGTYRSAVYGRLVDCVYDCLAQIDTYPVPATLPPAAIAWVVRLKEVRLVMGLMKPHLGNFCA
jgi:hypothetical protein